MKKTPLLLTALLLAAPWVAHADELKYSYIEAGYNQLGVDASGVDEDATGGYVKASWAFSPRTHVFAGYSDVSESWNYTDGKEKVSVTQAEIGIGYHQTFTDRVDFVAELAYQRLGLEYRWNDIDPDWSFRGKESTNAFKGLLGINTKPSPRTEFWLKGGVLEIDDYEDDFVEVEFDTEFVGIVGGQVKLTPTWGLVGEAEFIDDTTQYRVGIRASF